MQQSTLALPDSASATRLTSKDIRQMRFFLFLAAAAQLIPQLLEQVSVVRGFFSTTLLINPAQIVPPVDYGVMACRSSAVP